MTVLIDPRVSEACERTLISLGVSVKRLPLSSDLAEPVSGHPDLLAAKLPQGELLLTQRYYEANRAFFDGLGHPLRLTEEALAPQYPRDVLFDALAVKDTLYGRGGTVSQVLWKEYRRFVPVRQGYARCSTLLIGNAAVTADTTIAKALTADGMDVMKITPGHIRLEGYDYGFIGGASAVVGNEVLFFGNIERHPDHAAIVAFITSHGYTPVSLSGDELYDYGGAVINEE